MSDGLVTLEVDGSVARLTLNRPDRHNSLVPELLDDLLRCLNKAENTAAHKVLCLRANGRSFSTGGDLAGFREHRNDIATYADTLVRRLNDVMIAMLECPKPVITVVEGQVTGGALGMVLAADVVVATDAASFTPYYTEVGFCPDGGWTALLPDVIGRTRASRVQLLNETITPQQALHWGLISHLVRESGLNAVLRSICDSLSEKSAASIAMTKSR